MEFPWPDCPQFRARSSSSTMMMNGSVAPWPPCLPIATSIRKSPVTGNKHWNGSLPSMQTSSLRTWPCRARTALELLRDLEERGDLTPAIVLTGFGSMEKALSVVHDLKAFWYLEKPVEPRAFKILLERAILYKRSLQKTGELKRDLSVHGVLGDLAGTSPAMHQIFSLIRQVAPRQRPY